MLKLVLTIVLCLVIETCYSQHMPYKRIKRGKYYANQPPRYYSRPHPPLGGGVISYTPPPMYREDDTSYPGAKHKVSRPPTATNEGLGDDDLNNIIKYLTKQDLDKLIEHAKQAKSREYNYDPNGFKPSSVNYHEFRPNENELRETSNPYEKNIEKEYYKPEPEIIEDSFKKYSNEYNRFIHEKDDNFRPLLTEPEYKPQNTNYNYVTEPTPTNFLKATTIIPRYQEYSSPDLNNFDKQYQTSINNQDLSQRYNDPNIYKYSNPTLNSGSNGNEDYTNDIRYPPLDNQDTKNSATYRKPYSDEPKYEKFKFEGSPPYPTGDEYQNDFTNNNRGENIPKSTNTRHETEYELSYTNKIPAVAKTESSAYKVENFGELPLMEYNSKLASSDSYNVPHYTVISKPQHPAPSTSSLISSSPLLSSSSSYESPLIKETAPPVSAARLQSDAHLKATRIWTSKSRGTAYTLHDDGTLSLERPQKLRPGYGSYGF